MNGPAGDFGLAEGLVLYSDMPSVNGVKELPSKVSMQIRLRNELERRFDNSRPLG